MKKTTCFGTILLFFLMLGNMGAQSIKTTDIFHNGKGGENVEALFLINEIQSANIDQFMDPSFNFGGWIELYNHTDYYASLINLYVSDDSTNLKKSRCHADKNSLKPGDYALVWFGANNDTPTQANIKLDVDGGVLFISNGNGDILVRQYYPAGISRASYARMQDGGTVWEYTGTPTPGNSNSSSDFTHIRLTDPVIDTDSKFFTSPFEVKVDFPVGATLRYTTDGSTPTMEHGNVSTTGLFHIDAKSTVLRVALFETGKLPSRVLTRSYIYKEYDFNLPTISVVTDPRHLYDNEIGIFVRGTNGKPGNGQNRPCNWNMDWNRPTNVEYFTAEGTPVINQEAHIAACGGWSRAGYPKSFKIKANKKYEDLKHLPYGVFKSKPYLKHKTWQVRNGGNDSLCRMKDASLQEIVLSSGIDVEGQACQAVAHYINGQLIGLINLREPNNKDYAYANYGWEDEELDQFEMSPDSGYCQRSGTDEAFLQWYNLSFQASDDAVYQEICNVVDIDEYANYMAVHMYLGCGDYGGNNIKGFRPRIVNGKFRMVLYDLDSALGHTNSFVNFESKKEWTFNYDYDKGGRKHEEIKFITIFLNMLDNADFRKQFIDSYCLVTGSVFEPKRCEAIIDSMAEQRRELMAWEGKSPDPTANNIKGKLAGRQASMIKSLKNYHRMQLKGVKEQHVKLSSDIDRGNIAVNHLPVPTNRFDGALFSPITVQANTPAGYRFVGWKSTEMPQSAALIKFNSSWKYYDQGSLDDKSWKTSAAGISWKKAAGPFGYSTKTNNQGIKTILDYGGDSHDKRPTYYFFNEFNLNTVPADADQFILNYDVDDGIVVYINGQEVNRFYMPNGSIDYYTFATQYAGNTPNRQQVDIPVSCFKKGKNVIAVEVHNCNAPSSDLYFDAELLHLSEISEAVTKMISTEENFVLPSTGDFDLRACFDLIPDAERPMDAAPVVINEISAANSIYVNDYFKKRDWIELYNTTDEAIDIAGMYLTDDRYNLHKCQITNQSELYSTIIPAHGHLVIWADYAFPINQLHTNFTLSSLGGEVILTAADDSWSDHLVYEEHSDKSTIGRYPDGHEQWYVMSMPTIGAQNVINSYAESFTQPEFPVGIESLDEAKSSFEAVYSQRVIKIFNRTMEPATVLLYNLAGQCIQQHRLDLSSGTASVDLNSLRRGTYIAKIFDAAGHHRVLKFVIISER